MTMTPDQLSALVLRYADNDPLHLDMRADVVALLGEISELLEKLSAHELCQVRIDCAAAEATHLRAQALIARAQITELRELLADYSRLDVGDRCPDCATSKGHSPECILAAALGRTA